MTDSILLESTAKVLVLTEEDAENYIQELKTSVESDGNLLVDYKITLKETKDSTFFIVTSKVRTNTLPEAKEKAGV